MKVQVMIEDDIVSRIDKQARRKGLSRSAYCAQAIIEDMLHDEAHEQALERTKEKFSNLGDVFGHGK